MQPSQVPRRSLRIAQLAHPNIINQDQYSDSSDSSYSSSPSSSASSTMTVTDTETTQTETFSTNPFSGNINPSTSNGLKLYQAATASRTESDKIDTTITNQKAFLDAMKDDATQFAWGILTARIKIGNSNKNILRYTNHDNSIQKHLVNG
jgi:hypothetical protein